jgi:hypothetical protein
LIRLHYHRIGLLGGGGHCRLGRFRAGDHLIDADHEGVLNRSRLRMEKDRLGAVDIGILQIGQRRRGSLRAERLLEALAICRSIIEVHEGKLWASANEPRGAIFQFTLPAQRNGTLPADRTDAMPTA